MLITKGNTKSFIPKATCLCMGQIMSLWQLLGVDSLCNTLNISIMYRVRP